MYVHKETCESVNNLVVTSSSVERLISNKSELDTYRAVRKKFHYVADAIFGPGFLSMAEYYFIKTNGCSPFPMLFSEPRVVYDEWVKIFKGEEKVRYLIEQVEGPGHRVLLGYIQRNDGIKVWNFFQKISRKVSLAA